MRQLWRIMHIDSVCVIYQSMSFWYESTQTKGEVTMFFAYLKCFVAGVFGGLLAEGIIALVQRVTR